LEIDHGVGLLKETSNDWEIPDLSADLTDAQFDTFVRKVKEFPLINFEQAVTFIHNK